MADYPRSGSLIDANRTGTHTGLSTSIIVKVDDIAVGAIQQLQITTARAVERVREVGLDGILEVVPKEAASVEVTVTRVYFDRLRLPNAFARAFRNIHQQRVPFNIDIYDVIQAEDVDNPAQVDMTVLHNCWFTNYTYPFNAENYIITETASITAEYITSSEINPESMGATGIPASTDDQGVELAARERRGSLDVEGLIRASVGGSIRPPNF